MHSLKCTKLVCKIRVCGKGLTYIHSLISLQAHVADFWYFLFNCFICHVQMTALAGKIYGNDAILRIKSLHMETNEAFSGIQELALITVSIL